jgi:leucyl-tRNA synthetase
MFAYRWQEGGPWNSNGIEGTSRWLRRVWSLFTEEQRQNAPQQNGRAETLKVLRRKVHQTLRRVTNDFENFEFNTIISALMELLNEMYRAREAGAAGTPEWGEATEIYLKMLAPVAPHLAEELWTNQLGRPYSVHQQEWPEVDEDAAREEVIEIPVQVNGKVRDRITVPAEAGEEEIKAAALASENVQKFLQGKEPKKIIVAQKRLVNVVA